jgi:hypothetical protein
MNYALIKNSFVINVIVADQVFIDSLPNNADYKLLTRGGIGWSYDEINKVFIAPRPFVSWTLDNNYDWQAPKPKPDGAHYWDEDLKDWIKMDES